MPSATFTGTTALTYTQYLDADVTGTTLVAAPQNIYEIGLADNWQLGIPPQDGLWSVQAPSIGAGFGAVPGAAVAGNSSPGYSGDGEPEDSAVLGGGLGDALTISAPVTATFFGTFPLTYTQYLDTDPAGPGTTLVAEPQNTYQISVADGWNVAAVPGDGLWGAVPRGVLSFTITPGFAVIGGMSPGQPGITAEPELMESVFAEPAVHAAAPSVRVVRGRGRRLRPAPARRRSSRRSMAGRR